MAADFECALNRAAAKATHGDRKRAIDWRFCFIDQAPKQTDGQTDGRADVSFGRRQR